MSLKVQALKQTLNVFYFAVVTGAAMYIILEFVPISFILPAIAVGVMVWLFVLLYKFNLDQLESKEKLDKISKT